MILIDGEILTSRVVWYRNTGIGYRVRFVNNETFYNYSYSRMKVLELFSEIDLSSCCFYYKGESLNNVLKAFEFCDDQQHFYYHIVYQNGICEDFKDSDVKKASFDVMNYMNQIADVISLETETGKKILNDQMKKIDIFDCNCALSNYFKLSDVIAREDLKNFLIFPFGCNSSQYKAVENAIFHRVSVIEGPPGTGKTQTILNIIANLLIREMNCQVVSNNNAAIENVYDKLNYYNLDFFVALLGRNKNKEVFLENQRASVPVFSECNGMSLDEIASKLIYSNRVLKLIYNYRKDMAILIQKKKELACEFQHFSRVHEELNYDINSLHFGSIFNLKKIWNEIIGMDKISIKYIIKYVFLYHVGSIDFYRQDLNLVRDVLQREIYLRDLELLDHEISQKNDFIQANENYETEYIHLSMIYFKKFLSEKYKGMRNLYQSIDMKQNCKNFLVDYPVILSTTYSSRNTFADDFKFDYIIMDEASQIDVVTGTLALSSAKYAVIIGDEMQLPNVVKDEQRKQADEIFDRFSLDKGYSFSLNSFLSSVKRIILNVPIVLLQEHYRCHPKIINFCNKKFYNGQLIIMSEDHGEKDVIRIIRTNKGNHSREHANQRQVDVIKELLCQIPDADVGIIAPYNHQVKLLQDNISNVDINTVHKFQGREKDIVIISTVDDEISDFVANANILNVAIFRAKKQLFFVMNENEVKNRNIQDLLDYVMYYDMEIETSNISSVFDLLYKQYEIERLNFFKKFHKVSKYDTENLTYYLIDKIVKSYENIDFVFLQPLSMLICDTSLLNEREKRYIRHPNCHVDFLIFNKIGKKPVLAVEVDGYRYHKKGTKQYENDILKNGILEKYHIPMVRLKTNGSEEEKIIREMLERLL